MSVAAARHIIPISGKDSACTALVQTAREPGLPYEYMFNDAGSELPETYAWLSTLEKATGWSIERIPGDLEGRIARKGILPSSRVRFCTELEKLKPAARFMGGGPVQMYYGIRADEQRVGARLPPNAKANFPLVDLGIDLRGVWTILAAKALLPPSFFWPSLYYRVCEMLGGSPDWLEPWEFRMLFAGRSRSNCYFCFFQRQYEYLWLHETHPDLFWRACWIERRTGAAGFTWRQGYYLDELLSKRDKILGDRAKHVAGRIERRAQGGFYIGEQETELAGTSCGLFCGK